MCAKSDATLRPAAVRPGDPVVMGAGGHGKVIADILMRSGATAVYFLDDVRQGRVLGAPVIGSFRDAEYLIARRAVFTVALGDNALRARVLGDIRALGARVGSAVHPTSIVAPDVQPGPHFVAMARAVVNPGTIIGDDVCVNTGALIDHDCALGDHSHVFPGAILTGGVSVGAGATIGSGAVVLPGRRIGPHAFVGAGAVVTRDVPEKAVVAGVPAREDVVGRDSSRTVGVER